MSYFGTGSVARSSTVNSNASCYHAVLATGLKRYFCMYELDLEFFEIHS